MRSRDFGLDAQFPDFGVEPVGSGLVVEERDGQGMLRSIDIDILDTIESQDGIGGIAVSLSLRKQIVAIPHLRATVVVAWRKPQLVEDAADVGTTGTVGIVAYKDVLLVEVRSQGVDTIKLRQLTDDTVDAALAVHVGDALTHATTDARRGVVGTGSIAAGAGQLAVDAVRTRQRSVIGHLTGAAFVIELQCAYAGILAQHVLHLMATLSTTHAIDADGQRVMRSYAAK